MPAELANSASTPVVESTSFVVGGIYFLIGIGWLQVISKADSTHMVLKNLKDTPNSHYMSNSAPGTIVGAGSLLSPGGLQGPDGIAGSLTGPAGGDLAGTYPNPTIGALKVTTGKIALLAVDTGQLADASIVTTKIAVSAVTTLKIANGAITDVQVSAGNKDGLAATPSMRTIGTGALQAAAGNDPRFTNNVTQFASTNQAIPAGDAATVIVAHGLSGRPQQVRWVLVNVGNELNYAIGDEVTLQSAGCTNATDIITRVPEIADATNCQLGAYLWATNPLRLADKVSGVNTLITVVNWRLKVYAGHY